MNYTLEKGNGMAASQHNDRTRITNMIDIINKDITSNTPGSLLGRLWRSILSGTGYGNRLYSLVLMSISSNISNTQRRKDKNQIMNNVQQEDMTWKLFLSLLQDVIKVKRVKFRIDLVLPDNTKSTHTVEWSNVSGYTINNDEEVEDVK